MTAKNLDNMFHDRLREMYCAERHILDDLQKLRETVMTEELKEAFEKRHAETRAQIERLEQAAGNGAGFNGYEVTATQLRAPHP